MRTADPCHSPTEAGQSAVLRTVAALWDFVFGPPRFQTRPNGSVNVRLLGRRFEAASPGALFDAVARERERLMIQVGQMHEGAARSHVSGVRFTDTYHQQTRRVEDRIGLYTAFLGKMAKEIGLD